jgi:Flp pilus assembly protein CpaB
MEATENRIAPHVRRMLGTRSGTLALAAGVAVLAAIVLIAFLGQYKDNVKGGTAPASALVAGGLIPKGTSGDVVISDQLFKPTTVPTDDLKEGALTDTAALAGRVAARDIYPGQQITATDFAAKGDPIRGKLTGDQRAVALPVDTAHGLIGELRTGDRIDVYGAFNASGGRNGSGRPVVKTLLQNVLVLSVPKQGKELDQGKFGDVMVRVSDRDAASLAYAAENGKVWMALRAPTGASQQRAASVDLDSILSDSPTIPTEEGR